MAKYDVSLVDSFTVYDDGLKDKIEELLEESDYEGEGPTLDEDEAWEKAFAELVKGELESRFRNEYPLTFRANKVLEGGMKEPVPELWVTIGE